MSEFQCQVDFLVSKEVTIETEHATPIYNGKDEDGYDDYYLDTSDVNWKDEYENQHMNISQLLDELKSYIKYDLAMTGTNTKKGKHLQWLLKECQGWVQVNSNIEEL